MCHQCYHGVAVYTAKMKPTFLCRNINPNIASSVSYIEALKMQRVRVLLVSKTTHE